MKLRKLRNLGIIAHIDAGKTTTTERILFYTGLTSNIGHVDKGTTITDHLPMERSRGITIQSACIPTQWKKHRINIIDTPGHVDFTFEVERTLRILDGCLTIIDGVRGVQAQTATVWRQANRYKVPRVIFVNKMDRDGASFKLAVKSLSKLKGWGTPIPLQLPLFGENSTVESAGEQFNGIIDVIDLKLLRWNYDTDEKHEDFEISNLENELLEEALAARELVVEELAAVDDKILEALLEHEDHQKISGQVVKDALRKATIAGKVVPVLCGSAFRNIGIQPLLDAVVEYLPSPDEAPPPELLDESGSKSLIDINEDKLCALAFKVVRDPIRGMLSYVRVYSGNLSVRSLIKCAGSPLKERANKLLDMYAGESEEIQEISRGNIGVIVGLKNCKTGDTLLDSKDHRTVQLKSIPIPEPVFIRSLDCPSIAEGKKLSIALQDLVREDPSLRVSINPETDQIQLAGMGELHLEVAENSLKEFHKVNVDFGPVDIAFKEALDPKTNLTRLFQFDRMVGDRQLKAAVELQLCYSEEADVEIDVNLQPEDVFADSDFRFQQSMGINGFPTLKDIKESIQSGIRSRLSRGNVEGFPITKVHINVSRMVLYSAQESTLGAVRACCYEAMDTFLSQTQGYIVEPIMAMRVTVPSKYVGVVNRDFSSARRGTVSKIEAEDDMTIIYGNAPLTTLVGYAGILRSMTQGTGEWSMHLHEYSKKF